VESVIRPSGSLPGSIAFGLDQEPGAAASAMARELADSFGSAALGVIHYGSRARGDARADSAYDFFVIVDDYRRAYETLIQSTRLKGGVTGATALANVLVPNVHALPPVPDGGRRNKCGVLTLADLETAARLESRDHFVTGRLFQHVQIAWTRDRESAAAITRALVELRRNTFTWGRAFLPEVFDAATYARTLLETSFAGEIRPESGERSADLFEAQRDTLVAVYGALLQSLAEEGILERAGDSYRQANPPSAATRRRWERYFRRSKTRAMARWSKAVIQYDGWLDYIVQKITRHNDIDVELTERERRWPFIFLWPKIFLFFRERSRWATRR
jgi:hypothetical protein